MQRAILNWFFVFFYFYFVFAILITTLIVKLVNHDYSHFILETQAC